MKIIDYIRSIVLVYLIVFLPSLLLGIRLGATITFGIIMVWLLYRKYEEHHKRREDRLKELLINDGWSEDSLNHMLGKIEEEENNK